MIDFYNISIGTACNMYTRFIKKEETIESGTKAGKPGYDVELTYVKREEIDR